MGMEAPFDGLLPRVSARFEFRFESLKSILVLILVVHKLMIGSSKIREKTIRENPFEHKEKKPGLSASRPSNNWAHKCTVKVRGDKLLR